MPEFSLISSIDSFTQIRDRWEALAAETGEALPFSLFGWAETCLKTSPIPLHPYVIVGATAERVRFIAPLGRTGSVPGRRRLTFLASPASDYLKFLIDGDDRVFVEALWDFLTRRRDWDWMELYPVPARDAQCYAEAFAGRGARIVAEQIGVCPILELRGGWETRVSRGILDSVRYEWRRLSRLGQLSMWVAKDQGEVRQLLETLFALHHRRWAGTRTPSRFGREASRSRFVALAEAWHQAGMLDLQGLCVDGRVIAAHMGAWTPSRYYYYLPVFDPEFAKHSPGRVLIWKLIEDASARGIEQFDFLRGAEGYKQGWGTARADPYWRLRVWRSGWRGALRRALEPVEGLVRGSPRARRAAQALRRLIGE